MTSTHEVFNQVSPLDTYNLYETDMVLREAVHREGGGWHEEALSDLGDSLGQPDVSHLATQANRDVPRLHTHDANGNRADSVEFHPAWHALLMRLFESGVHCMPWTEPRRGAHVARAAAFFLHAQVEAGSLCPATMTFASMPVLQREDTLFERLAPKLASRYFDARDLPLTDKLSAMIGMGMTEKQGGSDVRSNTTVARVIGSPGRGEHYTLVGHKWFFSAPMCDAHLVLARTGEALSCFYVPRWRDDGTLNAIRIQRLKDKLGNRSNASAEVEFDDAEGILIGEPDRGVATIIGMAAYTRLDCVLGSAALMRRSFVQALHHARHRRTFGKHLVEHPLMSNVLADMALECEAATTLAMRLARACDLEESNALEDALWRIVTPATKFWICKRAIDMTAECMEVWGGNGYVEEGPMARMYREAPVNSIWEGSGNIMCLDVLRAVRREPQLSEALWAWLRQAHAGDARCLAVLTQVQRMAAQADEFFARALARLIVLLVQAALLRANAPQVISDAFITSRLSGAHDVFGMQEGVIPVAFLLQRAWA